MPSTLLAALARRPVGLKFGFSRLAGAPPYFVGGRALLSEPRKEISWSGRGFLERRRGEGEREREDEGVYLRRRLEGGEAE